MAAQFRDDPERARLALDALDPGVPREQWVRAAMAAKAAGLDEDDFIEWSSRAGNFKGERDCRATWRSIKPLGGVTAATLFRMARDAGWRDAGLRPHPALSAPAPRKRWTPPQAAQEAAGRARADAAGVWASAEPATPEHPYIVRKLGLADGLRVYRGPLEVAGQSLDGALLVPAFDADGELATWQAIPAEPGAKKLNAPGSPVSGSFGVGGPVRVGEPAYLCEGIGAAWSAHQATGHPAVVAFGAGRMEGVARDLRERFPALRLVLVPDVGKEADAERIAATVGGSWVAPPADLGENGDVNDLHQRDGLQAVAQLLARPSEMQQALPRFPILTADDLARMPPLRWRVRGVLPEQGLAAVYGPPGSGKSFLLLDLLAAVSDGRSWFGHKTRQCPVTLVVLEGAAGVAQRVRAYQARHGALPAGMRFIAAPFELLGAGDVRELADAIRSAGAADGVVVIDTLNAATAGADENSSADMGLAIRAAKALQAALGGLVVLVHHSGKDASKGLRGHSSLLAALDAAIELTRDGERREWRVAKSKDGRDGDEHPFRLEGVVIGTDPDDGEEITSTVVVPTEAAAEGMKRKKLPQGAHQRIVWDALGAAFRAGRDFGQAGAPPTRPCLRFEDAVEKCHGRLPVDSDRQAERIRLAISGLVSRGLLEFRDGWLWCT